MENLSIFSHSPPSVADRVCVDAVALTYHERRVGKLEKQKKTQISVRMLFLKTAIIFTAIICSCSAFGKNRIRFYAFRKENPSFNPSKNIVVVEF